MALRKIYELKEATARRDEAIRRVAAGTDEKWITNARAALVKVASDYVIFSPDELWGVLPPTLEPRQLGPIMVWGKGQGIVRKLEGCDTPSRRGHNPPVQVWVSLLHEHCPKCDDRGFQWLIDEDLFTGTFCDCAVGSDPVYQKYARGLLMTLGRSI